MVKKNTATVDSSETEAPEGEALFDLDVSEVPSTILLDEGEYLLRVDAIDFKKPDPKPGKDPYWFFQLRLSAVDYPTADTIFYMVPYPTGHEDEAGALRKKRRLKAFLDAVGIDTSAGRWDSKQAVGAEFYARVRQKADDRDGRLKNEVAMILQGPSEE